MKRARLRRVSSSGNIGFRLLEHSGRRLAPILSTLIAIFSISAAYFAGFLLKLDTIAISLIDSKFIASEYIVVSIMAGILLIGMRLINFFGSAARKLIAEGKDDEATKVEVNATIWVTVILIGTFFVVGHYLFLDFFRMVVLIAKGFFLLIIICFILIRVSRLDAELKERYAELKDGFSDASGWRSYLILAFSAIPLVFLPVLLVFQRKYLLSLPLSLPAIAAFAVFFSALTGASRFDYLIDRPFVSILISNCRDAESCVINVRLLGLGGIGALYVEKVSERGVKFLIQGEVFSLGLIPFESIQSISKPELMKIDQ